MTMPQTDGNGNWINNRGKAVPPEFIDPVVRNRDRAVERAFKKAEQLQSRVEKVKAEIEAIIDKHLAYVDKKTEVTNDTKGNLMLTSYAGDLQLEVRINDLIEFDSRLQNAKTLIDQCIHKWSEGANRNIAALVNEAFDVDKKGNVNTANILRLRQINIKDADWKRAMELITESIQVAGTRRYLRFKRREGGLGGKWETLNLNFSSI